MQVAGIRVGGGKLCAGVAGRGVFVNFLDRMTNGLLHSTEQLWELEENLGQRFTRPSLLLLAPGYVNEYRATKLWAGRPEVGVLFPERAEYSLFYSVQTG